jgi:hypothetical protein
MVKFGLPAVIGLFDSLGSRMAELVNWLADTQIYRCWKRSYIGAVSKSIQPTALLVLLLMTRKDVLIEVTGDVETWANANLKGCDMRKEGRDVA